MARFYSQHGEDFILDKVFRGIDDGFFVEVGCIDGRRFSNTLHFEELGWSGMCIEAHTDYIDMIKKNRPNSNVIHCAIGEKDEDEVTFYANERGTLSSLDKSTEERWKRDYSEFFTGFNEQKVAKRTLTSIFKQHYIDLVDILSIDIEGYEVEALSGLDLNTVAPKVIVIESDSVSHEEKLTSILYNYSYILALKFGGNLFFSRDSSKFLPLYSSAFRDIEVIHTCHPLDQGSDSIKYFTIDLNKQKIVEKKWDTL